MKPLDFNEMKNLAVKLNLRVEDLQSCIAFDVGPRILKLIYPDDMVRMIIYEPEELSSQGDQ